MNKHFNKFGFTLIELLVVMGLIAFVASSSVVIFGNFSRKQSINIAYDNVSVALAEAKSFALSQVVTSNCNVNDPNPSVVEDQLVGYQIRIVSDTTYALEEVCLLAGGGEQLTKIWDGDKSLPTEIAFISSNGTRARFFVLDGGAEAVVNFKFESSQGGDSKTIRVTEAGKIQNAN